MQGVHTGCNKQESKNKNEDVNSDIPFVQFAAVACSAMTCPPLLAVHVGCQGQVQKDKKGKGNEKKKGKKRRDGKGPSTARHELWGLT